MPRMKIRDIPYSLSFRGQTSPTTVVTTPIVASVFNGGYTFAAWIRPNSLMVNNHRSIFRLNGGSRLWFNVVAGWRLRQYNSDLGDQSQLTPNNVIAPGVWNHVLCTYSPVDNRREIYVNGVLITSSTTTGAMSMSTETLAIGSNVAPGSVGNDFCGEISEAVAFDRALTQDEITRLYQSGSPESPLAFYKLDEGTGDTANDSSGNGNNGTITNGTWSTNSPSKPRQLASGRLNDRDIKASLMFSTPTTSAINPGSTFNILPGGSYTFCGWLNVRPQGGDGISRIFDQGGSAYFYTVESTRQFRIANQTNFYNTNPSSLVFGKWTHLAAVFSDNQVQLFVDGVPHTSPQTFPIGSNINPMRFFRDSTTTRGLNGHASDLRFYDSALTQGQIVGVMNGKDYPGKILHYMLDEGAGAVAYDSSASGNNGTIVGGAYSSNVPIKARQPINRNLVYNGNFEFAPPPAANVPTTTSLRGINGTAAGSNAPAGTPRLMFGWETYLEGAGSSAFFDRSESYRGECSMRLSVPSPGGIAKAGTRETSAGGLENAIAILPGVAYRLSGFVKRLRHSGGSDRGAGARIVFMNGTRNIIDYGANYIVLGTDTSEWEYFSNTFTAPSNARFAMVEVEVVGSTGAGTLIMDAWFDDIELKPVVPVSRQLID